MPFTAGISGNPSGANGRKPFIDALNCLLTEEWTDGKVPPLPCRHTGAQALAHKLVKEAMNPQGKPEVALAFIKEISDRAYGRPIQPVAAEFKVTHGLADRIERARRIAHGETVPDLKSQ